MTWRVSSVIRPYTLVTPSLSSPIYVSPPVYPFNFTTFDAAAVTMISPLYPTYDLLVQAGGFIENTHSIGFEQVEFPPPSWRIYMSHYPEGKPCGHVPYDLISNSRSQCECLPSMTLVLGEPGAGRMEPRRARARGLRIHVVQPGEAPACVVSPSYC